MSIDVAGLYDRVKTVIPPGEWAAFLPDVEAIQRLKRNATPSSSPTPT